MGPIFGQPAIYFNGDRHTSRIGDLPVGVKGFKSVRFRQIIEQCALSHILSSSLKIWWCKANKDL